MNALQVSVSLWVLILLLIHAKTLNIPPKKTGAGHLRDLSRNSSRSNLEKICSLDRSSVIIQLELVFLIDRVNAHFRSITLALECNTDFALGSLS